MKTLWFRAKRYPPERARSVRAGGYGWTPCSWQGWLVLALYIVLSIATFRNIDLYSHSGSDTLIGFFLFGCFIHSFFS